MAKKWQANFLFDVKSDLIPESEDNKGYNASSGSGAAAFLLSDHLLSPEEKRIIASLLVNDPTMSAEELENSDELQEFWER